MDLIQEDNHFTAHQQALLKNDVVIAVLAFPHHSDESMQEAFAKFDYDTVIDLCDVNKEAFLGSVWDGTDFNIQPYPSWVLNEKKQWEAPYPEPDDGKGHWWDESRKVWADPLPLIPITDSTEGKLA